MARHTTGGPLFWIFAENAIAIIGACLPTLAPLWSGGRLKQSRIGSYANKLFEKSKSNSYSNLPGPYKHSKMGVDTSTRHLVQTGPATSIISDNIPLEDRPQRGIQVRTAISYNNAG
ncbi:MAG: hypothetical protein Q9220_000363 [cf. Caloplaca sp. 1 TL-2023]